MTSLGGGQVNPATGDFVFGVAEGFLIEDGEVTTPVRGANLIGRAIEVMSAVDAVADDFDTWEGVCGKDGQGAPVGQRLADAADLADHGRRHRCLTSHELCAAAVEAASGDEAVEAYAEESRQTEASALRGEIEGLTFAESRGVGVRLIADGRLGYAYAADPTLDEVRDAVRRARENAALAEPDEFNVLPVAGARPRRSPSSSARTQAEHRRPTGRSRWRWTWSGVRSRSTRA